MYTSDAIPQYTGPQPASSADLLPYKQDLFDFIIRKLWLQGRTSVRDPGNHQAACMYRGAEGARCAVGHLIDDKQYNPGFENQTVGDDGVCLALHRSGVCLDGDMVSFLNQMQKFHDVDLSWTIARWGPDGDPVACEGYMEAARQAGHVARLSKVNRRYIEELCA